jgi:glutamyl-tRNA synthetase
MAEPTSQGVRVRFAPSPTGFLHIGGLRTALYNFLFARRAGGRFVLRVEDTDRDRFVEQAEADILDGLKWAGLTYDEGPEVGGSCEPYYQSERKELYKRFAQQLIDNGSAYYAFDTVNDLERMREQFAGSAERAVNYDSVTRKKMTNSLTLPADEVRRRLEEGAEHVIRLKITPGQTVRFQDVVRDDVSFDSSALDDQVLVKSDGMPTYHLANVVDDHLMGITHVIRGEEWLPSTPKHVLIYRFLGWTPPSFAHLPLILSPSGGKLSKRNAEDLGIPVTVRQFREAGYEPEALINFLAFLGWNPGTERELFTLDELAEVFSLDRVGSSGVQLDVVKLNWFNEQYIRSFPTDELVRRARPFLDEAGIDAGRIYLIRVAGLMQERISFIKDLADSCRYFFEDPSDYDEQGLKKRWKDDSAGLLVAYAQKLQALDDFTAEAVEETLRAIAEEREVGAGRLIHPTRLAVSGVSFGPSLFHMMEVIGKDACIRRIQRAAEVLG